jgi:hypothetical protein
MLASEAVEQFRATLESATAALDPRDIPGQSRLATRKKKELSSAGKVCAGKNRTPSPNVIRVPEGGDR